jgi:hypothetical protein
MIYDFKKIIDFIPSFHRIQLFRKSAIFNMIKIGNIFEVQMNVLSGTYVLCSLFFGLYAIQCKSVRSVFRLPGQGYLLKNVYTNLIKMSLLEAHFSGQREVFNKI